MRECPRCEICYEDEVLICPQDVVNTKHTLPCGCLLSGRYLLEKRLGRGAMGQVYLARDQNLVTRRVAVKTVRPDILSAEDLQEGEAIARFEREARAAASIRHPNVVDVTDFGQSPEGISFLVMEYVDGETLYQLLHREGTLNIQRAAVLLRQIVAGVEAAHDEGILHRDLKPANIFITQPSKKAGRAGADGFVKVGDFGLAKIVHADRSDLPGATGPLSRGIIGTPEYMAPEQMQEGVQLDTRADIYALGAIAYHMLGGRPPFTGNITQLITQKLLETPRPLTTLRSDISAEVERALMQALARNVAERPANVGDWFDGFETAVGKINEPQARDDSRLVVMAPPGSEFYVDDERHASVGRSGRILLTSVPPGQHVLRVARAGEADDERVIEIRPDSAEQIIQAQFRSGPSSNQLTPSRGGSLDSQTGAESSALGVVMCSNCHSRFAEGVRFCGRCGGTAFQQVAPASDSGSLASFNGEELQESTGVTCPGCSHRYAPGTRYCGMCGIAIGIASLDWDEPKRVEVLCKGCGKSYPVATKFCGQCGEPISV
jgi:serine/threonine protein kinase